MAVPTVYRWDDANAPQVTNIHDWSQVKAWFQAIFVDGYLEDDGVTQKPGLGWGLSFDDATYRVYLTQAGTFLQQNTLYIELDYTKQCDGSNYYGATVVGVWENTDKVNELFKNTNYNHGIQLLGQNDDDTKICPWVMVGTSRTWWNLCGHNHNVSAPTVPTDFTSQQNYYSFCSVGDYINDGIDMGKHNQYVMFGNYSYKYINSVSAMNTYRQQCYHSGYTTSSTSIRVMRDAQQNVGLSTAYHYEGLMANNSYVGGFAYPVKYPYPNSGLLIKPFELWHHNDHVYLGKIPGIYYSPQGRPLAHTLNFIEFDGTGEYAGDKFIGLGDSSYNEFYINITEDWGVD